VAKTIIQLPKAVKIVMASITDPVARGIYKRSMLEAEASLIAGKNRKFSDPAVSQKKDRNQNTPQS
jgi:hypothetical protein